MHHIVNNLWLGSQQDADALARNNPENITAILNVRGPDAYHPPGRDQSGDHPGKAYKWIPAPDNGVLSREHVKEALAWLQEQTDKHQRILIHCNAGISRSPAFLSAFMVKIGICSTLDEAKAAIRVHRAVQPALQFAESDKRVLLSPLTGLPNFQAFEDGKASPFVAVVDVDYLRFFNEYFGHIAGDVLLRRIAKALVGAGLDAYHYQADKFLCKGESREELTNKLVQAREFCREPFQIYFHGGARTIEGAGFSFGIGANAAEMQAALQRSKKARLGNESPAWLRDVIATSGHRQP